MKVSELIDELKKENPDAPVLLRVEVDVPDAPFDDVFTGRADRVLRTGRGTVVVENRL